MKQFVYADNAATTALDKEAFDAMVPYMLENYGNPSQSYSFSRSAKIAIKEARETIANCIGAYPDEIYFTSGGTESDNWAICESLKINTDKKAVITSRIEHHAILRACQRIEAAGVPVAYLQCDKTGTVSVDELKSVISPNTKLVSVMYANNEIGTIEPIRELCQIAHCSGALFHTDAVQAVGHIEINVHELNVDMLSASAHKFNGPKGVGFLFVRRGVNLPALICGGEQERGMRAGTENVASITGMAVALKNCCSRISTERVRLLELEEKLITDLQDAGIDFLRNGSENHIPGNVSLSFKGCDGEALLHRMDLMGICISTGAACDTVKSKVSHVISAIKTPEEYAKGTIRISLGLKNTLPDIDAIVKALKKIILGA